MGCGIGQSGCGDRGSVATAEVPWHSSDWATTAPAAGIEGRGLAMAGGFQEIVLVASCPLADEGGRPLAEGEWLAITGGHLRTSRPT